MKKTPISHRDFIALVNSRMRQLRECEGVTLKTLGSLNLPGSPSQLPRACAASVKGIIAELSERYEVTATGAG